MKPTGDNLNGDLPQPQDWAELLSAYADGELTDAERGEVETRLASDGDARRLLAEFRAVSASLEGLPREVAPRDLSAAVLQSAERRLLSGEPDRSSTPRSSGGLTLGRSPRGWLWAAAAIAAAVFLMVSQRPDQNLQVASAPKPAEAAPRVAGESSLPELRAPVDAAASAPMLADERAPLAEPLVAAETVLDSDRPVSSSGVEGLERGGGFGGGGGRLGVEFDSPPVIVRVGLRPEAFENRFVDAVLSSSGIVVEPTPAVLVNYFREAERRLGRTAARRADEGLEAVGEVSDDKRLDQRLDQRLELVLVDAPIPQVVDAVSMLNRDFFNCVSLQVEPAVSLPPVKAYNDLQQEVLENRKAVSALDAYSRQAAGPQQQQALNVGPQYQENQRQQAAQQEEMLARSSDMRQRGNAFRYQPQDELAEDKADFSSQINLFANEFVRYARGYSDDSKGKLNKGTRKLDEATTANAPAEADYPFPVVFFVQPAEPQ
jgi:hypothetical protein